MLTLEQIRQSREVTLLIEAGNHALDVMGFTDHGPAHVMTTAKTAGDLLQQLGYDARTCELARIAGYIHDIGNAVNRSNHAESGAILAFQLLREMGMDSAEAVQIMSAIGNHDDGTANAITPLSAALILADKSDVRRSRVRCSPQDASFDIHDRVNYAVESSCLTVHPQQKIISLCLKIDTALCPVMDYFEIFLNRMRLCRKAAEFLGQSFELIINQTRML